MIKAKIRTQFSALVVRPCDRDSNNYEVAVISSDPSMPQEFATVKGERNALEIARGYLDVQLGINSDESCAVKALFTKSILNIK